MRFGPQRILGRVLLLAGLLIIFSVSLILTRPSHHLFNSYSHSLHTSHFAASSNENIPLNIWQIFLGQIPDDLKDSFLGWINLNPDHTYVLMRDEGVNAFVRHHYADRATLRDLFLDIKLPVFRSDLLRYMILESEEGIYSDLDAVAQRPIKEWIPEEFRSRTRAVVGIEYDQLDDEKIWPSLVLRVQFCQ